jgi:SAM-dependent methyltransferase
VRGASLRQRLVRRAFGVLRPGRWAPEGKAGVILLGHRDYVGGLWDEIGRLQSDFLRSEGLSPSDVLLDVGCGSLRGGVHFIPYLEAGHYLGIDKEPSLLAAGRRELGEALLREKQPELIASDSFEFDRFSRRPTFALAQSLFTHLDAGDIATCLGRLRPVMADGGRFYTTFFEGEEQQTSPESHSWAAFTYPRERLAQIGEDAGWTPAYVGDFGHPRGQVLMRFDAS